jgi:hypothetical protein
MSSHQFVAIVVMKALTPARMPGKISRRLVSSLVGLTNPELTNLPYSKPAVAHNSHPTNYLPSPHPFQPSLGHFFAYLFVHSLASFSHPARSTLYCSAIVVSTASSGFGSFNNCLANSNTAEILVLGFQRSGLSMPRHMAPLLGGESLLMLGW